MLCWWGISFWWTAWRWSVEAIYLTNGGSSIILRTVWSDIATKHLITFSLEHSKYDRMHIYQHSFIILVETAFTIQDIAEGGHALSEI